VCPWHRKRLENDFSCGGTGGGNVDALFVVGARVLGVEVVRGWAVDSEWLGVVLSATCEADVDGRPAVGAGRSTWRTARLDRLVGLTDEGLVVVTASDCQRLLLHARTLTIKHSHYSHSKMWRLKTTIIIVTRGQSNLTKSASRGAHSPVRGHPRGSKVVPLNSWGRVSY